MLVLPKLSRLTRCSCNICTTWHWVLTCGSLKCSAAVESTGAAKAEAQSRAEAARIQGEAAVSEAKLKAEAQRIEAVRNIPLLSVCVCLSSFICMDASVCVLYNTVLCVVKVCSVFTSTDVCMCRRRSCCGWLRRVSRSCSIRRRQTAWIWNGSRK